MPTSFIFPTYYMFIPYKKQAFLLLTNFIIQIIMKQSNFSAKILNLSHTEKGE